jgi:hypothetical protein
MLTGSPEDRFTPDSKMDRPSHWVMASPSGRAYGPPKGMLMPPNEHASERIYSPAPAATGGPDKPGHDDRRERAMTIGADGP